MKTGFRKAHMRAFCYNIRDMNYRQMRAYALYGISQKSTTIDGIDLSIYHRYLEQMSSL